MKAPKKILAVGVASLLCFGSVCTELSLPRTTATLTASAASTLADFPSSYQSAADWIWTNRIEREQSTVRTLSDGSLHGYELCLSGRTVRHVPLGNTGLPVHRRMRW